MTQLVLASASAGRAALLRVAGVEFQVSPASLDETRLTKEMRTAGAGPGDVAAGLAARKALAVSHRHPGRLVLGADTVVVFQGEFVEKAADMTEAEAILRRLAGASHLLVSAAALTRDGHVLWSHVSPVCMTMRRLGDRFLADYLAAEGHALLSTVGCYRFEGRGAQLFEKVEGDYFSVLGLPLLPLLAALREEGVLGS